MKIKVTLVKSLIGAKKAQKATAESLGLKKIGDFIITDENPAIRGKVNTISHLVKAETV